MEVGTTWRTRRRCSAEPGAGSVRAKKNPAEAGFFMSGTVIGLVGLCAKPLSAGLSPGLASLDLGLASLDDDGSPFEHSPELIQRSRKGVRQGSCRRELEGLSEVGAELLVESSDGVGVFMLYPLRAREGAPWRQRRNSCRLGEQLAVSRRL